MPGARTAWKIRFAILLVAALLCAQWAGLAHRISHAPFASGHVQDDEQGYGHSCVTFDAAAVADALALPVFALPPLTAAAVLALWTAFASWDAPPVLHFSSRAPPVS